MAHIYAFGVDAPGAKGIIHLGATSCYVTDNADLILYRDGLRYLEGQLEAAMQNLCDFADQYASPLPRLHTISPRSWSPSASARRSGCRDLMLDLEELRDVIRRPLLRLPRHNGHKASFVSLFEGRQRKNRRDEPKKLPQASASTGSMTCAGRHTPEVR